MPVNDVFTVDHQDQVITFICRKAAIPMTLNNLQGHLPVANVIFRTVAQKLTGYKVYTYVDSYIQTI